jgi:hypothetical protein
MNKEVNRHLRALTFDNLTLTDYSAKNFTFDNLILTDYYSLPFGQRILNSNHSDRLKISASELLFGSILKIEVSFSHLLNALQFKASRCLTT